MVLIGVVKTRATNYDMNGILYRVSYYHHYRDSDKYCKCEEY